jgi:hypothetical protein
MIMMKLMRRALYWLGLVILIGSVSTTLVLAQSFDLTGGTIDSGGGTLETNDGAFIINGTIGQPDVGVFNDTGGTFVLSGGLWQGVASSSPGSGQSAHLPVVIK